MEVIDLSSGSDAELNAPDAAPAAAPPGRRRAAAHAALQRLQESAQAQDDDDEELHRGVGFAPSEESDDSEELAAVRTAAAGPLSEYELQRCKGAQM